MEASQTDLTKVQTEVQENPHTVAPTKEVCQPGDKECLSRWITAFSDCE